MPQTSSHTIAQSTPTGGAVGRVVSDMYSFGEVHDCTLFRRGFNQVYGVRFASGRRAVARLSAARPRGAPNIEYEAAFLSHLKGSGVAATTVLPTKADNAAVTMDLPEGGRPLMLFEYLEGEPPGKSPDDIEATGRGLALMHEAGRSFDGPVSLYQLELPFLLSEPFSRLKAAPTIDDELCDAFASIVEKLEARITAVPGLTRVICHGDCHGANNFMTDSPDGTRVASFFDFDDIAPGLLAYELAVYLWANLPRKVGGELDAESIELWRRYIAGYRSVRPITPKDFEAIAAFVVVRDFWLMGEYAGRSADWGTQVMSTRWLRQRVDLLTAWVSLSTPE